MEIDVKTFRTIRGRVGHNGKSVRVEFSRRERKKVNLELTRRNRSLEEQLSVLRSEHDELRRTIFEAAHMQRRLCGPRHVRREPFTLASELFPVQHLSGDLISVFDRGAELVFAIGDIAGKGLAAGMWFTHLVGLIRLQVFSRKAPAAAMSAINQELCNVQFAPLLTSLFLATLNIETDTITYCNAGHPPCLLIRHVGPVESLDAGGPILGAVPDASYVCGQSRLWPGDSVLAYSDGIVECRNARGAEFGTERLLSTVGRSHNSSASGRLFSLLGAVEDFAGSGTREDDFALMFLHRDEANPGRRCELSCA